MIITGGKTSSMILFPLICCCFFFGFLADAVIFHVLLIPLLFITHTDNARLKETDPANAHNEQRKGTHDH